MGRFVLSEGCFSLSIRYLTTSRDGIFWYYRRIPLSARMKLGITSNFVRVSLRTRDRMEAICRLAEVNTKHEAEWFAGSPRAEEAPNSSLKALISQTSAFREATGGLGGSGTMAAAEMVPPPISEALSLYLSHHPNGANKRFTQNASLSIGQVIKVAGDLPLDRYTRQDALAVRDALLTKNKTTSVKRRFNTINAVFSAANEEHALNLPNPFSGIRIGGLGSDTQKREEFTMGELKALAGACRQLGDERRLLTAILLDTGARLGEIVGLRVSDVFLSHATPYIHIRAYTGRSLKTPSSERRVPLVGEALWAAQRAVQSKGTNGLLFPGYGPTGANSASAALNKWVKERLGIHKTMHGLRHTMKTRLRVAGVPEDIQNRIGGWTDGESVSRGYGSYPLELLREHLLKVVVALKPTELHRNE